MIREIQLETDPQTAGQDDKLRDAIQKECGISASESWSYKILRSSLDARSRNVKVLLKLAVYIGETIPEEKDLFRAKNVSLSGEVHIIGAGPAAIFCALQCIENGYKPVLFERGKNVRDRRRDLAILNKQGILNEESNYCFGEGGAGTYSDGKLYTRSNKRGSISKVLDWFYYFGADPRIRYEAHPHIGTNKLPHIIEAMREEIIRCGGEIHFNSKLTDFDADSQKITAIEINHNLKIPVRHLVLATGHSAHDIYELLVRKNCLLHSKPFALGVRIEHPQAIIDSIQYHCETRNPYLPPASYSLVEQVNGRGVFSFCMCPGGIIAPASTRNGALVVNGWSPSKRNNPYANSGMVVSVDGRDFKEKDPLSGLQFQYGIEQKAYQAGGGNYVAPAQRATDFLMNKISATLPDCSYLPGIVAADLREVLPPAIIQALQLGLNAFGKKYPGKKGRSGYLTHEAVLVATESRTSSPVRIPRDEIKLNHPERFNLYPCAEGAGYAGGIVSAAMDGMRIANQIASL